MICGFCGMEFDNQNQARVFCGAECNRRAIRTGGQQGAYISEGATRALRGWREMNWLLQQVLQPGLMLKRPLLPSESLLRRCKRKPPRGNLQPQAEGETWLLRAGVLEGLEQRRRELVQLRLHRAELATLESAPMGAPRAQGIHQLAAGGAR